jgi:hypothetical protein
MLDENTNDERHAVEAPPPLGDSWAMLYTVVFLNLAALVVLFYLFTRAFG